MKKKFDKRAYLKSYYDMLLWRKFEEKCAALYIQQKIRGFLHLYNGQEAILSGMINSIDPDKCLAIFKSNNLYGLLIFFGLLFGKIF